MFFIFGTLPYDGAVAPSAATDATILVCTFLKLIVLSYFFFWLQWIVRGNESRAKNTIIQRVTLGEHGLATGSYDGVP